MSFKDLQLNKPLLRAIAEAGYDNPTLVQERTIPLVLNQKDVITSAQTGTGKTAAFGLPIAHLVNFSQPVVQALVLCPTRELCLQISKDLKEYCDELVGSRITAVYGGSAAAAVPSCVDRGAGVMGAGQKYWSAEFAGQGRPENPP